MGKQLNIIVKMKFGSHLYGTNTESSDLDFKGIFLPRKEDIFLNRIPKSYSFTTKAEHDSKNTADDIDTEIYSLHYFIKLACEGQTVAIDMLHAPDNMITETSNVWKEIVANRSKFYTKNLKAFIGYARRQAAKYGIKGSRLNAAKNIVDLLGKYDVEEKLEIVWDELPTGDHLHFLNPSPNGIKQYQVCGKILQATQKIGYTIDILTKFYTEYGKRAKLAAENKGIDWKAVSHAMRAAYQVKELLTTNTITFPLENADYILQIKNGELDFQTEVSPALEKLMDEVEELSEKSTLPLKPNRKFWDKFLIQTIENDIYY